MVEQTSARLEFNQDIDVASIGFFTPCYGPENPDIVRSVNSSCSNDLPSSQTE